MNEPPMVPVPGLVGVYAPRHNEGDRLRNQVAAAKELLDGLFANDLHSCTGIPLDRCSELLSILRDE